MKKNRKRRDVIIRCDYYSTRTYCQPSNRQIARIELAYLFQDSPCVYSSFIRAAAQHGLDIPYYSVPHYCSVILSGMIILQTRLSPCILFFVITKGYLHHKC